MLFTSSALSLRALIDAGVRVSFEYFDACVRLSRQRTTHYYKDFKNELELYESYGSISNITGYKSFIARNIDAWYALSIASGDFGFFSDIIEEYKQKNEWLYFYYYF